MTHELSTVYNQSYIKFQEALKLPSPSSDFTQCNDARIKAGQNIRKAIEECINAGNKTVANVTIEGPIDGELTSFQVGTIGDPKMLTPFIRYSHLLNAQTTPSTFDMRKIVDIKPIVI